MRKRDVFAVGLYVVTHFRTRAAEFGIKHVARQMRKQGYPPEIAALVLAPEIMLKHTSPPTCPGNEDPS